MYFWVAFNIPRTTQFRCKITKKIALQVWKIAENRPNQKVILKSAFRLQNRSLVSQAATSVPKLHTLFPKTALDVLRCYIFYHMVY